MSFAISTGLALSLSARRRAGAVSGGGGGGGEGPGDGYGDYPQYTGGVSGTIAGDGDVLYAPMPDVVRRVLFAAQIVPGIVPGRTAHAVALVDFP